MTWSPRIAESEWLTARSSVAAEAKMTISEWCSVQAHYRRLIFAVVKRVGIHQSVGATACVLFASFTLPRQSERREQYERKQGYRITTEVHAEILICAVVSVASKLEHYILRGERLIEAWRQELLCQNQSLSRYISECGTAGMISACEYYLLDAFAQSFDIVLPFPQLELLLSSVRHSEEELQKLRPSLYECAMNLFQSDIPLFAPPMVLSISIYCRQCNFLSVSQQPIPFPVDDVAAKQIDDVQNYISKFFEATTSVSNERVLDLVDDVRKQVWERNTAPISV